MKKIWKKRRILFKIIAVSLTTALMLQLSGCALRQLLLYDFDDILYDVPETVEVEGETYRKGFYSDDLWPVNLEHSEEKYVIDGITFYPVEVGEFDCLHAPHTGKTTNGTVYCLDSQWEEAKEYYADLENFTYYCEITPPWIAGTEQSDVHQIDDMDAEMFDALRNWADNRNDPFDAVEQTLGDIEESDPIYLPSLPEFYCLFFYKKSIDGCFQTFQGDQFSIIDGTLYYIHKYNGKEELLYVIEVPEETASYFIELVKSLDSPYHIE